MTHGSLFSGIGGFDLAAEWMGWQNVFHCEWNPFCQKVLKYYWPEAKSFTDIIKTDFTKYANKIDILTGGFPCQPYSSAGKRLGKADERHLWPQMLRAIREIKPTYIVGENVRGLLNWNGGMVFDEVCAELEALGYQVAPCVIPACGVGAPHRRERIWFVAYSTRSSERTNQLRGVRPENGKIKREGTQTIYNAIRPDGFEGITTNTKSNGFNQCNSDNEINTSKGGINAFCDISKGNGNGYVTNTQEQRLEGLRREEGRCTKLHSRYNENRGWETFPTVSPICTGDDGISDRLDSITFSKWRNESIKAGGNAIVPQVAFQIFKAIEQINKQNDYRSNVQAL